MSLIHKHQNVGRVFGKLYVVALDPDFRHGYKKFGDTNTEEGQRKLFEFYSNGAKHYSDRIFFLGKTTIPNIRNQLNREGLDGNNNYMVMRVLRYGLAKDKMSIVRLPKTKKNPNPKTKVELAIENLVETKKLLGRELTEQDITRAVTMPDEPLPKITKELFLSSVSDQSQMYAMVAQARKQYEADILLSNVIEKEKEYLESTGRTETCSSCPIVLDKIKGAAMKNDFQVINQLLQEHPEANTIVRKTGSAAKDVKENPSSAIAEIQDIREMLAEDITEEGFAVDNSFSLWQEWIQENVPEEPTEKTFQDIVDFVRNNRGTAKILAPKFTSGYGSRKDTTFEGKKATIFRIKDKEFIVPEPMIGEDSIDTTIEDNKIVIRTAISQERIDSLGSHDPKSDIQKSYVLYGTAEAFYVIDNSLESRTYESEMFAALVVDSIKKTEVPSLITTDLHVKIQKAEEELAKKPTLEELVYSEIKPIIDNPIFVHKRIVLPTEQYAKLPSPKSPEIEKSIQEDYNQKKLREEAYLYTERLEVLVNSVDYGDVLDFMQFNPKYTYSTETEQKRRLVAAVMVGEFHPSNQQFILDQTRNWKTEFQLWRRNSDLIPYSTDISNIVNYHQGSTSKQETIDDLVSQGMDSATARIVTERSHNVIEDIEKSGSLEFVNKQVMTDYLAAINGFNLENHVTRGIALISVLEPILIENGYTQKDVAKLKAMYLVHDIGKLGPPGIDLTNQIRTIRSYEMQKVIAFRDIVDSLAIEFEDVNIANQYIDAIEKQENALDRKAYGLKKRPAEKIEGETVKNFAKHVRWGSERLAILTNEEQLNSEVAEITPKHHQLYNMNPKVGIIGLIDFYESATSRMTYDAITESEYRLTHEEAMDSIRSWFTNFQKVRRIDDAVIHMNEADAREYEEYIEIMDLALA